MLSCVCVKLVCVCVCEFLYVTFVFVKLVCVKLLYVKFVCVKLVLEYVWRREEEEAEQTRDTESKTRTPHKVVGNNFWDALLMVFAAIFCLFVFLSFGHAALRLCLPDLKLMWGHGACANPIFYDGKCWNSAGS